MKLQDRYFHLIRSAKQSNRISKFLSYFRDKIFTLPWQIRKIYIIFAYNIQFCQLIISFHLIFGQQQVCYYSSTSVLCSVGVFYYYRSELFISAKLRHFHCSAVSYMSGKVLGSQPKIWKALFCVQNFVLSIKNRL